MKLSILMAPIFALAACSSMTNRSQSAPSTAAEKESKAEAQLCQNMARKGSAIREFPEVTGETDLQAVKKASEKAEKAVRDVQNSSREVNRPSVMEVSAAFQNLQNSVNGVPGGRETVGETSERIREDARRLRFAWDELLSAMQCGA